RHTHQSTGPALPAHSARRHLPQLPASAEHHTNRAPREATGTPDQQQREPHTHRVQPASRSELHRDTYDRRGFSRSPLVGPQDYNDRLATDADDVTRLIEHHGESATVFGTSSGAVIALTVLPRHPNRVSSLAAERTRISGHATPDAA